MLPDGKRNMDVETLRQMRNREPTNRGAFSCLLNRIVDSLFSKKAIYQMLVSVQSCFNSRNTRYYNNVMATADHVTVESIRHLQPVKFGPLTVTAPDDLEVPAIQLPDLASIYQGGTGKNK